MNILQPWTCEDFKDDAIVLLKLLCNDEPNVCVGNKQDLKKSLLVLFHVSQPKQQRSVYV